MMVLIVVGSAILLLVAYLTYGRVLPRLFRLDDATPTPAVAQRDDLDYAPLEQAPLLSQHFSAIAAAGPIVGPILAGVMFGWLPALIWIVFGSILIGGVHDFSALVASVRHRGGSIANVVRQHMSGRSFVLFLIFVWIALVYIIVAFTDVTAGAFVEALEISGPTVDGGSAQTVAGAGIATSSLLYLALAVVMGLVVRFRILSMSRATLVFLPLVALAIWFGQSFPLDITGLMRSWFPGSDPSGSARKTWDVVLLAYCAVASIVPVWLLLQPRGQLGGWFLYAALAAGALGLLAGGQPVQYPAFRGWTAPNGDTLFPFLFITIACGACSGFHALIATGTTSKQLQRERDARGVGYGAMLLEGMVAVVALCCVMMLATDSPLLQGNLNAGLIYAQGIGAFLESVRIPAFYGVAFALMAFTTFIFDTLDVCTRLGRFIFQELSGWRDARGRWLGTLLTALAPLPFVLRPMLGPDGKPVPVWKTFWTVFGASNQLLAALTLLAVTVWLWRTRRVWWAWLVTGVPTLVMYVMSSWALLSIVNGKISAGAWSDPVLWVSIVLVGLALLMLIEAIAALLRTETLNPSPGPTAAVAEPV
jgi:carbon starvation protein